MTEEYLIKKWLFNELTTAEKKAFDNLEDTEFNNSIIEDAKLFKASNFSKIVNFETFKKRYLSRNEKVIRLYWLKPILKVASVAAILISLYVVVFSNKITKITTLASQKTSIKLPDNSMVNLNALSTISYNNKNWENNRTLQLDGEAYFKVAKGEKFDIITSEGKVSVVGTQFNVKQRKNYFEVLCFEGIVKVSSNNKEKQLLAGDTFQIINHKFTEGKTVLSKPQWINNRSVFKAIPIKEVFDELERQYQVKISFNKVDNKRLFSGSFPHDNLENALKYITEAMDLTYQINSQTKITINEKKH